MSDAIVVRRLGAADARAAHALFTLFAEVFETPHEALSDAYVARLLARDELWILAAFADGAVVGGITAHVLPMTRAETSELFIFDLAVRTDRQRRGIGRQLVTTLRTAALAAGLADLFVPADDEDVHALDFYRSIGGDPAPVTIFTFPAAERAD